MPNVSIKNVPEGLLKRLRLRAERHHRSLQGELMLILEEAVEAGGEPTVEDVREQIDALGLRTPDESTDILRAARESR